MPRTGILAVAQTLHHDWLVADAARRGLPYTVISRHAPSAVAAWIAANVPGGRRLLTHPRTGQTTYCFSSHVDAVAFKMQFG
ncbi:hypothetical protein [Methylobacterium sp. B1]|uniref:hypothetical protein n=1 Tax=Methylobacterium sp. B1 TaxID=91459 RepID=UPI0003477553|nr:hypothetical protein [Methylobacterium sp. B1]